MHTQKFKKWLQKKVCTHKSLKSVHKKKGAHTQKFKKCLQKIKKKCAQTKVQKVFTKIKKSVQTKV